MFILLTSATAVNHPSTNSPATSLSSSTVMVVAAIFTLLIAATLVSGKVESLAAIAATALRALIAELRGLVIILLTLLLVLAMVIFGSDGAARSGSSPPTTDASQLLTVVGAASQPQVGARALIDYVATRSAVHLRSQAMAVPLLRLPPTVPLGRSAWGAPRRHRHPGSRHIVQEPARRQPDAHRAQRRAATIELSSAPSRAQTPMGPPPSR